MFDSGVGGLSVARRVIEMLPAERLLYFADTAHVPYGERPLDEIREFALDITAFLVENGAKAIVMACNMSSAVALEAVRRKYPDVAVVGVIEPGAKAAVEAAGGAPIGVLATTGTIRSGAYVRAVARLDPSVQVIGQACPAFVPLIEAGLANSEQVEQAARMYVAPLLARGCRTIILGCTHYPFVRRAIQAAAGEGVKLVDPAEETARVLANTLLERGLLRRTAGLPHRFLASGDASAFASLAVAFLGRTIDRVDHVDWEKLKAESRQPSATAAQSWAESLSLTAEE